MWTVYRGGVTRSRISQILNLRNLAPKIQEHLLLEPTPNITERMLHTLTRELDWRKQVARFDELKRIEPVGTTRSSRRSRAWLELNRRPAFRDSDSATISSR